mgnify:CR=1 FL=1
MKQKKRRIGKILMVLSVIFFYLPILYMIIFSFNDGKSLTSFTGFSLRWYRHMLDSSDMMEALSTTFSVAVLATIISTIVGTISAIGISKSKKVVRDLMDQVNNLPLMNPEIVTAIGFMLLFITFRVEKGYVTMLLAHIAFCIPYVMLSVMPKIRSLDPNLADAAMDLGATPWQALTKVIVPQITPGIVSGALIAFTMSVDDFIISYFVTGRGVKNLSIMVYTMSKRVNPSINAISTLVVVIITIVLLVINIMPMLASKRKKTDVVRRRRMWIPVTAVCAALVAVICVAQFGGAQNKRPFEGQTLRIYNWGEYVGEHIIQDFEKETGAKVMLENFDSNEQMYIKVANKEAYDILVPSDYMIERLISEGYLQKLDKSKLTCMDKLNKAVKGLPYDPKNEYSVPYFWGTVGILYNKTMVDDPVDSWGILWNEKYKDSILMQDSVRDAFGITLKYLGYSLNSTDLDELTEAKNKLIEQKPLVQAYVVDQARDKMIGNEAALAVIYSGEAITCQLENPDLEYVIPKEGSNMWIDSWVIPKNAKNKENAEAFINFMCRPDIAKMNFDYITYSIPNEEGRKLLAPEYRNNPIVFPDDKALENCETFKFLGDENDAIYNELWRQVKSK